MRGRAFSAFEIGRSALGVRRFLPPNPPTCIRPVIPHSYSQMSGMFFDNPGVRFSKRSSVCQSRLRLFASVLFRWLTGAGRRCFRINSRLHEAERSEEHTSELQSQSNLVCRLLLEKKKK